MENKAMKTYMIEFYALADNAIGYHTRYSIIHANSITDAVTKFLVIQPEKSIRIAKIWLQVHEQE